MTGFGSGERGSFRVEMRSLNNRFMDISIKLPHGLARHEIELRNTLKEEFSRGRFDVCVYVAEGARQRVRTDTALAKDIYQALQALKDELQLSGSISVDVMAGFRDIIISEEAELNETPMYEAFMDAVAMLSEMREREGGIILQDMLLRIDAISLMNSRVASLYPEVVNAGRDKFIQRLNELFGKGVVPDTNRIIQEVVLTAEKMDISEELTRISSHTEQMKNLLLEGGTIGRKAEFLVQELNREVNTISSKAGDPRVLGIAVEMKNELEKMREQVQNIQ